MTILFSPSDLAFFDTDINTQIPDDAVEVTSEQHEAMLTGQASGKVWAAGEDGQPLLTDRPPPDIATLVRRKRTEIEAALSATLAAGMPYTLPDGTNDTVQTRPDQDEANLLGLAIEARDLRAGGETGAVMSLRAKSNAVYTLTPEEMIALTDAAKNFKQALLAKSWKLKDVVSGAEQRGDREAISAVSWGGITLER